jgi:rubrerythrin
MNVFNAAEAVAMGIEKEKARRDFYSRVAKSFKEKEMSELFTRLSAWEEEHVKRFTEIRKEIEQDETTESFPGEMAAYFRAIVDDKLYTDTSASGFAKNVKTALDAIRYGLIFERDAILFFTEIAAVMSSHDRASVQKLIDEEKQHIIYLAELKEKIS